MAFMDENYLLNSQTGKKLYHEYASGMPIFDYHCHLSAKEIFENRRFKNLTEIWLAEDHYKWRILRANGVEESFITGDSDDKDKFLKWAETLPLALGNPLYSWSHLELQRFFGIKEILTPETAETIWEKANGLLQQNDFSPRNLIFRSNVKGLCTTDDPLDNLEYHMRLREDSDFDVKVLPTFRPDGALNIDQATFAEWVSKLGEITNRDIASFKEFVQALNDRIDFFHICGCRLSDHGLDNPFYMEAAEDEVELIFTRALSSQSISSEEAIKFKTALMKELGKSYSKNGWAMQLHIGALRNNNSRKYKELGPNTGFDSINDFNYANDLAKLLDSLDINGDLPRTIIYCLNPRDNYMVASMIGNFQENVPGKIQFGTAWWFNDQKDGMEDQIRVLANVGLLSRFVGMLTDSRSLLSYTRHEYFRRILCNIIGGWVENGEYPEDYRYLEKIIKDICYFNIEGYLGLQDIS